MNNLVFKLWGLLNNENADSINYTIAQTILENIYHISGTSTASLAQLCNVSKPSISRFVKGLGYGEYSDFRTDLRMVHNNVANVKNYSGTNLHHLMNEYLNNCKNYISTLQENISEVELEQLARQIFLHEKIYLVGNMQSGSIAQMLQFNLFCAKKMTIAITDVNQYNKLAEKFRGDEVIVLFSTSGQIIKKILLNDIPATTQVYLITTNLQIGKIKGCTVINCKTGDDLAAGNISLSYISNIIYLKYIHLLQEENPFL